MVKRDALRCGGNDDLHENIFSAHLALAGCARRRTVRRSPSIPDRVHSIEIPLYIFQPDLRSEKATLVGACLGEERLNARKRLFGLTANVQIAIIGCHTTDIDDTTKYNGAAAARVGFDTFDLAHLGLLSRVDICTIAGAVRYSTRSPSRTGLTGGLLRSWPTSSGEIGRTHV